MKGRTYFRWWGFSINEGEFPNIHISWMLKGQYKFYFRLALSKQRIWRRFWGGSK